MTKLELEQRLAAVIAERDALGSKCAALQVQLEAERSNATHGGNAAAYTSIKAAMAAAKAKALATGKCTAVRY
jgi:hypothetical protein